MDELNKEIILKLLEKNGNKIRSFAVTKLTLFGSFARDEQSKNSDIDFLVEFDENLYNVDGHLNLLHFLEDIFNKKIDLVKPNLIRDFLKTSILNGKQYEASI